ncbi:MAG: PAC2 family protein [Candidatus Korarchaeota archaeon]|nr:PAC2 family protein [Candidatus Korarchaeota archaeon]
MGCSVGYIELVRLEEVKPKDPVLVQGVPGLGLVGKIAANYLIKKFDAKRIAIIYSDYLPLPDGSSGVRVEEENIQPPCYEIYYVRGPKNDLLVLTSEVQPIAMGQYRIGELVLDYAQELGVSTVITMGGYVPASPDIKGVFACTNDDSFMGRLKAVGVQPLTGGYVTGAAGLLIGLADLRGMTSVCLLGTTSGAFPDPKASKMVLEVLDELYNLGIDLEELERETEAAEEIIKEEIKLGEGEEYRPEEEERGLPYHG